MRHRFNEQIAENEAKERDPLLVSTKNLNSFSGTYSKLYKSKAFDFYGAEIKISVGESDRDQKKAVVNELRQELELLKGENMFLESENE